MSNSSFDFKILIRWKFNWIIEAPTIGGGEGGKIWWRYNKMVLVQHSYIVHMLDRGVDIVNRERIKSAN